MESVNILFLEALRASLLKKTVIWEAELTKEQWGELFAVASAHHVLPMIYGAVFRCKAAQKADPHLFMMIKQQVRQQMVFQTVNTDALLKLLSDLTAAGVTPLVVKGIICRELYPNPDSRISSDEDLLVPEEQFAVCHEKMLESGMELADSNVNLDFFETSYLHKNGHLFIELHRHLFNTEWDIFNELNQFFEGVHERAETQYVQGIPILTLNHTDHLFYLICHSFKHFLNSGFGIRQVCDICLYANAFGNQIDWEKIKHQCEEIHADIFTIALFRIGEKYLTFKPDVACCPTQWQTFDIDETPLLVDLMHSGVYGKSSMSRVNSGNVTLHAVSSCKYGEAYGNGYFKALFPSKKYMRTHYSYLQAKPYLLPLAWAERILKYGWKTMTSHSGNSTAESLKIGNQRTELLKQYGIIDR